MELIVTGIQKTFSSNGSGEATFHLELPEMKFQFGAVNYIMGHNGSGKTVFIKLLSGELSASTGSVKMTAEGKTYSPSEMNVAVVRQKAEENLCLDLSVEENLLLRLSAKSMNEKLFPKKYLKQQVIDSVNGQNELGKKLKQVSSELSGGQKQSLAFFSATAQKSKLLCLDEFLSSTDYNTSQMLRQKTKQYAKENNACVLIVSHDFDVALEDAEKIFVLNDGKLSSQIERNSQKWNKTDLVRLVHLL